MHGLLTSVYVGLACCTAAGCTTGLRATPIADRTAAADDRNDGRCPCSGLYDNRFVEVRLTVNGKVVVLTDVPQGACPDCGSRIYKAGLLEGIEALMRGWPAPVPRSLLL